MNENERQNIAKELTLQLSESEKPFALKGKEENFGPDDWAWLFLRMNKEYKIAYAEQKGDIEKSQRLTRYLDDPSSQDIKADLDGSCAGRFGLSAWLNPEQKSLPALSYGGSWFFPLKRLVSEGPYPTKASDKPHFRSGRPFSNVWNARPRLFADESPFGYRILAKVEYPLVCIDIKRNWILAAIDCGIPPDGQISALATLAKITRIHLTDHGRVIYDDRQPSKFVEVRDRGMPSNLKFAMSGSKAKEMDGVPDLWRVIAIDSLGPLAIQTEGFLALLKKEHRTFIANKWAVPSPPPMQHGRFANNLPTCIVNKVQSHGGNYLKALHVVAELAEKFDDKQIMDIIKTGLSTKGYANTWREEFHGNIRDKYVKEGTDLIDSGYKWLIHAQKPNSGAVLRPMRVPPLAPNPNGAKERVRPDWD